MKEARVADDNRQRGLGRGLSALLGEDASSTRGPSGDGGSRPRTLPIAFLKPNKAQPRRLFRDEDLKDLADSIREKGILQPILVRPGSGPENFEIVAGERRWRAAQLAKLHEVPVIVRELSDVESLEIAIIENVQRADLNAIEEAAAYQDLMSRFHYTQERVSTVVGKSRSHVANTLRLLKLPRTVQSLIMDGRLSAGHARTLIGVSNPEKFAQDIVNKKLNVRQAERKAKPPTKAPIKSAKDADTKALETGISNALGMKVEIEHQGNKGGLVHIHYKTLEQLDDIMHRLSSFVEVD